MNVGILALISLLCLSSMRPAQAFDTFGHSLSDLFGHNIHGDITLEAFAGFGFQPQFVTNVIDANRRQDWLEYFNFPNPYKPEHHFDRPWNDGTPTAVTSLQALEKGRNYFLSQLA